MSYLAKCLLKSLFFKLFVCIIVLELWGFCFVFLHSLAVTYTRHVSFTGFLSPVGDSVDSVIIYTSGIYSEVGFLYFSLIYLIYFCVIMRDY